MNILKSFWFLVPLLTLWFADATDPPPAPPPPAPPPAPPPDTSAAINSLIDRHDKDLRAVIQTLFSENYQYRERIRGLNDDLKEAKGQIPKKDQAILDQAEADLLEKYKAAGDIEALIKLQGEFNQAKEQLGALQKESVLRDVADLTGYKLPVLKKLAADLDFEIREVEQDGKKSNMPFVKNGDQEAKSIIDYAAENWADFLPALQAEPAKPKGTPYPPQDAGGGKPPPSTVLDDFLKTTGEARASLPNPLIKK